MTTEHPSHLAAVVSVSGGLASWATAKLASHRYPTVAYLFNDVLIEDADLYRFLLEGMANVLGVPAPLDLMALALTLPDVDSDENVNIRRALLADIQAEAMRRLPGFTWQSDGRTPWEVWRQQRFIGNSRIAHCSIDLKAKPGDRWAKKNAAPDTVQEFGMYWDEGDRIEKLRLLKTRPVGDLLHSTGMTHSDLADWAAREGLRIGRSYAQGYSHDNCSGLCCRAGQRHWAKKYAAKPAEARYLAEKEAELLRDLPASLPMLTDRRGDGKKKPLPLHTLLDRIDADAALADTLDDLGSGCGCVFDAMTAAAD